MPIIVHLYVVVKMKDPELTNFLDEMQDVAKLSQDKIKVTTTSAPPNRVNLSYRRNAAEKMLTKYLNFLTDGDVDPVQPQQILTFKISGIQPNVFKNLKQAKYGFDFHLDLHRMSVSQARHAIFKLVSNAETEDIRCFLLTHGKGERSKQPARLKSYVNHWLQQFDQVVAFHSALAKHGGTGSVYVLLKKPKLKDHLNQAKYS